MKIRVRYLSIVMAGVFGVLTAAHPALAVKRPKRVMIVVMDQMQPGYATLYNMQNVLWLQSHGVNFPKAYTGHMTAETVVSHNVMVSGLFPKHMGWSDEVFRDVNNLLGYGAGTIVTPGDFSLNQFLTLIQNAGYFKLGNYLHSKFPGTIVANVGEKSYQVESMAASSSDIAVRMGSRKSTPLPPLPGKWRGPAGLNVPTYISEPLGGRFYISSDSAYNAYSTNTTQPAWIYPEDGRYAPGNIPGHESGDNWVADATMAIMEHENWSGLWVTFSAIDKIGHMWGGGAVDTEANYHWDPTSIYDQVHMRFAAQNADAQLGKLLAKLQALGQFNETLIVLTADHGSTWGKNFYGVNELDASTNHNWYLGYSPTGPENGGGNPNLKPLEDLGNVAFSYNCNAITTWLTDFSWDKKVQAAQVVSALPGVIATYVKKNDHYILMSSSSKMTRAEHSWWIAHGQELVNTMAFSGAADVVGLLADSTSYGAYGDHGGAQEDGQRIPMAIYMPGMRHVTDKSAMRLVDIMPTVLKAMGILPKARMDGRAYDILLPR